MITYSVSGFEWILLFAILGTILSVRLRLPPVAGLLISGMLIGPNVLGLVDQPTIEVFAEIGATLLLFMIGIEFSVSKLLKTGLRAILCGLLLVTIMFVVMHETAILLDFDSMTSLYVAAIFSFSSTAIMMKILEQKNMVEHLEVPILVAILIIEDIVAIFLLTFFSELKADTYTAGNIFGAVVISLAILGFFYVIFQKILRRLSTMIVENQNEDTQILFSIALGIGMSILATLLGLSPAIGAFLAGSMIAGLPDGRDFERSIKPFSRLFSAFFFISIGMLIDPYRLVHSADIALILIGVFLISVFLTVTFAFYLITSSGRSSIFAGLAMLPMGEFSLLLAKESIGIVEIDLVGIVSAGVLVSSVLCSLMVGRSHGLYGFLKKALPQKFQFTLKGGSAYVIYVIGAFEPGGNFHRLLIDEVRKLAKDIIFLASVSLFFMLAKDYLQFEFSIQHHQFPADQALLIILLFLSLIPLAKLAFSLKRIFDALSSLFSMTPQDESRGAILKNLLISALFFLLFANVSVFVDLAMLPRFFNWFSLIFGLFFLSFFWSALSAASSGLPISEKKITDLLSTRILTSQRVIGRRKRGKRPLRRVRSAHPLIRQYE